MNKTSVSGFLTIYTSMAENKKLVTEELNRIKRSIVRCNKHDVPEHKFIETVSAGAKHGHILFGKGKYWLCVRSDDTVSYENIDMVPFGYSRDTLYGVKTLAIEMDEQFFDEKYNHTSNRSDRLVKPIEMEFQSFFDMIDGQSIIHIKTGVIFPLFLPRQCITDLFQLNAYNLHTIFQRGVVVKNFCRYATPENRKVWRDIIGKSVSTAITQTCANWTLRRPGKQDKAYTNFVMERGHVTVQISNSADLSRLAGIDSTKLREYFSNGCEGFVNGWRIKLR